MASYLDDDFQSPDSAAGSGVGDTGEGDWKSSTPCATCGNRYWVQDGCTVCLERCEIPLGTSRSKRTGIAAVEHRDYLRLKDFTWTLCSHGYAARRDVLGRRLYLHREVLGFAVGDGRYVDHINGDRLDNRRSNLRSVEPAQNVQNLRGGRENTSSKHRGVGWDKETNKWRAYGQIDGRTVHLGRYEDEDEAAWVAARWRSEAMPYSSEGTEALRDENAMLVARVKSLESELNQLKEGHHV